MCVCILFNCLIFRSPICLYILLYSWLNMLVFFFNMAITEVLPMERWKKKKEKNFQGLKVITSVTIRGFFTGNIN